MRIYELHMHFFFFNDTATTEIYTLSLHDALPIFYDTGARVQELVDLSVGDVPLDPPAQIRLLGKGRKMRAVPLMANTVQLLRSHMQENHLDHPEQFDKPLFHNARHERLTRSGVRYILHKYVVLSRSEEHTSELQSRLHLVCRLLLEKKKSHQH